MRYEELRRLEEKVSYDIICWQWSKRNGKLILLMGYGMRRVWFGVEYYIN